MASVSFSPTAALMLPMRKRLSSTPTTQRTPPMAPVAVTTASFMPVFRPGAVQLGPVAGEAEGITGCQLFVEFPERAGVQYAAEPVIGPHGEVVAAQGADGQRLRHVLPLALPAAMGAGD